MNDVLNPVREVTLTSGTLEVRELAWPQAMEFFRKLSAHVSALIDEGGEFQLTAEKLIAIVQGTHELSEWLMIKSTARDAAWLQTLRPIDAITILDAAIELNLNPELIERGKRLAERVQAAFGLNGTEATKPSAASSTSSSPKVTPSRSAAK